MAFKSKFKASEIEAALTSFNNVTSKLSNYAIKDELKTINGESILGSGNIEISSGNSSANVQAVDTGDVIDDVTVEYATKAYVDSLAVNYDAAGSAVSAEHNAKAYTDSLVGDINSVLEEIINGDPILITFTVEGIEYQAEEGMTFYEWAISDYYNESVNITTLADFGTPIREYCLNNGDTGTELCSGSGISYTPKITTSTIIQDGGEYVVDNSSYE